MGSYNIKKIIIIIVTKLVCTTFYCSDCRLESKWLFSVALPATLLTTFRVN